MASQELALLVLESEPICKYQLRKRRVSQQELSREGPWCERVSPQEREGEKEILTEDLLNSRLSEVCSHAL